VAKINGNNRIHLSPTLFLIVRTFSKKEREKQL